MSTFRGVGTIVNGQRVATPNDLSDAIDYSTEWANRAEDSLVSTAAGGDQVDDYSALHHAAKAAADAIATAADAVATAADVVSTNADVVSTNADVVTTNADAATTTQDAIDTAADAVATAADAVSTAADAAAAAASAAAALASENAAAATLAASALKANNLSDMASAATSRTNLGVAIGTDVQAYDADLLAIAALTHTKGNVIVSNGSAWINLGVGSNDEVLTADSAEASGVKWAAAAGGDSWTHHATWSTTGTANIGESTDIPSGITQFKILTEGASMAGTGACYLEMGDSVGYTATWKAYYTIYNGATVSSGSGPIITGSISADDVLYGDIEGFKRDGEHVWHVKAKHMTVDGSTDNGWETVGTVTMDNATELTRMKLRSSSTWDAGAVQLFVK